MNLINTPHCGPMFMLLQVWQWKCSLFARIVILPFRSRDHFNGMGGILEDIISSGHGGVLNKQIDLSFDANEGIAVSVHFGLIFGLGRFDHNCVGYWPA